jgi:hypothetical protein
MYVLELLACMCVETKIVLREEHMYLRMLFGVYL